MARKKKKVSPAGKTLKKKCSTNGLTQSSFLQTVIPEAGFEVVVVGGSSLSLRALMALNKIPSNLLLLHV